MAQRFRLTWKGTATKAQAVRAVVAGLNEFHIGAEAPIKAVLYFPGHGVLTGTLRRSIHAAAPSYNFGSDDVLPTSSSPERGGTGGGPEVQGDMVVGTIGSGLSYAAQIHDMFQYITRGYENHQHELLPAIEKHAERQGLK